LDNAKSDHHWSDAIVHICNNRRKVQNMDVTYIINPIYIYPKVRVMLSIEYVPNRQFYPVKMEEFSDCIIFPPKNCIAFEQNITKNILLIHYNSLGLHSMQNNSLTLKGQDLSLMSFAKKLSNF